MDRRFEQRERWHRSADATGRVDPWRDLPRDGARIDLAIGFDAGSCEQRRDSRTCSALQPPQTEGREDAVLRCERYDENSDSGAWVSFESAP